MNVDPTSPPPARTRGVRYGSTPAETFRGAMVGRTAEGAHPTVIVTRQGEGCDGRVWLTFDGAIKTTVVMTDGETGELRELLDEATLISDG